MYELLQVGDAGLPGDIDERLARVERLQERPGVVPEDIAHLAGREARLRDVVPFRTLWTSLEGEGHFRVDGGVGVGESLGPRDRHVGAVDEECELDRILRQRGRSQGPSDEGNESGQTDRGPLLLLHRCFLLSCQVLGRTTWADELAHLAPDRLPGSCCSPMSWARPCARGAEHMCQRQHGTRTVLTQTRTLLSIKAPGSVRPQVANETFSGTVGSSRASARTPRTIPVPGSNRPRRARPARLRRQGRTPVPR